jgi:3D (Asp-Asp-Asp) domain-containing protein
MRTLILLLIPIILDSGDFCINYTPLSTHLNVSVSVYNATVKQCDSTPLLTASGAIIDTTLLKQGKLKWCAISRNLKSKFKFNDTIHLHHEGVLEKYIVKDIMDKRYFNKVDILHYNRKYCKEKGKIIL